MPPMASDRIGGLQVLFTIRRNALSAFPKRCLHEPVVRLRAAGRPLALVTAPDAIGHMMITHADDYVRLPFGRRVLGPIVGKGLLVSEGETWRQQRRAMAPAFAPRNIPIMSAHIMRCTEASCERLAQSRGRPVNLLEEMQTLSLEIAATSLFSMEAATFGPQVRALVSEYMGTVGRLYLADVFLPEGTPTRMRRRRADFRKRWTQLIASIIEARHQSGTAGAPRDLFDLLAQAHGPDRQDLLADEVSTMIVAGHETTALTLFWMCTLLAKSPEWQGMLAEEATRHDLSVAGAGKSLPKLEIARAVVQETLRLYSPGFMAGRLAKRSHEVCGVEVPEGSIVLVPFWLIHRTPQWWPNPTAFDPSRFLNDADPARHTYLPFGVGRHVCIGAQLAMSEATLAIARLAQQFTLTMRDERPVLPVATLTTRPDHAPEFVLQPRAH
ncbi:MAG: cytochrome P450 [Proteobacteria bacterium]|nr:cytochrome P450 [Pseudomonadota bacterium]